MPLSDVLHQPRADRLIRQAMSSDRMPHAYIFHGPEGVGRELFAERLARMLLCEKPDGDACGLCRGCEMTGEGTHPDLHLIYRELIKQHPDTAVRARKGIDLGIDVIRTFVLDRVARKASMGQAKVFIVREAEKMTRAAQNALLKTLEEPPARTFIILVAAAIDALLTTVRSRCQPVAFGLLPPEFIVQRLRAEHPDISEDEARFCAQHANGSLGVALRHHTDGLTAYDARLAETVAGLAGTGVTAAAKRIVDDAKKLGEHHQKRDADISNTEAQRRGLKALFSLLSGGMREGLHASVGADTGGDGRYAALTGALTPRGAAEAIRTVVAAERHLDLNVNTQLCVEGLLIRLGRLVKGAAATSAA